MKNSPAEAGEFFIRIPHWLRRGIIIFNVKPRTFALGSMEENYPSSFSS